LESNIIYWTQDNQDWQLWDAFIQSNSRGIYLQIHSWLDSYRSYGFTPDLLLAKDIDGKIIGGMGVVLAGIGPMKILVAPYGPIVTLGGESILKALIDEFKKHAKSKNVFLAQLSLPAGKEMGIPLSGHLLPFESVNELFSSEKKGMVFKYVTGLSAFRAIDLFPEEENSYEKVRTNYKTSTRRDVNKSGRMGHELQFARTDDEIKKAYELIELNADSQGYSVRSWDAFGKTLIQMVDKGQCIIPCCFNEGDLKGALIIFDVGNKLHYIMGATLREQKDKMVGHYLQDQVIQIGIEKGYDFYDISMGGSEGVVRFKEGFGGIVVPLTETRYWVQKPLQFLAYQKLLPWVQKNKALIGKLLGKIK
jgi:lipid II:glycine glycyltransferase (peptidoglycan interpeptide bridge formation enzyme)